jgi:hypothetical protein
MAIAKVVSKPVRRGEAGLAPNNLLYEVQQRKYTRTYMVHTTYPLNGPATIYAYAETDARLPKLGQKYNLFGDAIDNDATCIKIDVNSTDNPKIWELIATFDTERLTTQYSNYAVLQPPELYWDSQPYERPMRYDNYGIPVTSSSGNLFDPPAMIEEMRTIYRVTRYELYAADPGSSVPGIALLTAYDPETAEYYKRTLNKYPFKFAQGPNVPGPTFGGKPTVTARINNITAHLTLQNGTLVWQTSYEVEFRKYPDTFIEYYLDQDYRDINGNLYRDPKDQMPYQNQTPQNGRGLPLSTGATSLAQGVDANTIFMRITSGHGTRFPPRPKDANTDGVVVGPHYNFYAKIDDEIVYVYNTGSVDWKVDRGAQGTIPAAHALGASVRLQPYFLRFIPRPYTDWTPLNLEAI